MKKLSLLAILLITVVNVNAQGIGELAPDKPNLQFPPNAIGADIVFSEGGVGLGSFYKHNLSESLTFITTFSITEAKDDNEFTYVDPFTLQTFTTGKKNRIFLIPFTLGMQYRLFRESLLDNLRPFIDMGVGPSFVITTPYEEEFLKAFGRAHNNLALGGYIGFGANFGIDKSSLVGLNIRYYFVHLFNDGVESLVGNVRKDFNGVFLTLSLGVMY